MTSLCALRGKNLPLTWLWVGKEQVSCAAKFISHWNSFLLAQSLESNPSISALPYAFGHSYLRLMYHKWGCCEKEDMNSTWNLCIILQSKYYYEVLNFLSILHLIPYCINIQMNLASEIIPAFFGLSLRIDEHFLSLSIRKLLKSPLILKWNSVILILISKWTV